MVVFTRCIPAFLTFLTVFCLVVEQSDAQNRAPSFSSPSSSLSFIRNKGQWPAEARYLARLGGMDAWVTDRGIVYDFYRYHPKGNGAVLPNTSLLPAALHRTALDAPDPGYRSGHVVAMEFVGASGRAAADEGTKHSAYHNYFLGRDSTKWARRVPLYGSVVLEGLYEGIDAVLRFDEGSLRYDLHVAAGADPEVIRMKFSGSEGIGVNERGELVLETSVGEVVQGSLYGYQVISGREERVEIGFRRTAGGEIGFAVGSYDRRYPLVIDPLVYSTLLGGTDYFGYAVHSIAVNNRGEAYVTGGSTTGTFPTTPGAYDKVSVNGDMVIAKLNASGTDVFYATFVGGIGFDAAGDIAIDPEGNAYVTGSNSSGTNDFPTTPGAFDTRGGGPPGSSGYGDAVVFKLSADGTALIYSTFLAGAQGDGGTSITIDSEGNAYVTGVTSSGDFPTTPGVFRPIFNDTASFPVEGFVTKLNADGSALIYSTLLGGIRADSPTDHVTNAQGQVIVVGKTNSPDFLTTAGSFDRTFNNPAGDIIEADDAFALKLNANGTGLIFSTFLGGVKADLASGVALDSAGNIYVIGMTYSADFPVTPGAFMTSPAGGTEGFVAKLDPSGSGLLYSTLLGGNEDRTAAITTEGFRKIAVDGDGNAVVCGLMMSADYPFTRHPRAIDSVYNTRPGQLDPNSVITKLNAAGSALLYSTFFGNIDTYIGDIALDSAGYVYVTGLTKDPDFPLTRGVYDTVRNTENYKEFVSKLRITCMMRADAGNDTVLCNGAEVRLGTAMTIVDGDASFSYAWEPSLWLDDPSSPTPTVQPKGDIRYILTVTDREGCQARDTINIDVLEPLSVYIGSDVTICPGDSVRIGGEAQGGQGPYRYEWEPADGLSRADTARASAAPKQTTAYRLRITDALGCTLLSDSVKITLRAAPMPVIAADGPTSFCSGDSVVLDGGDGYADYRWSNGERTQKIIVKESGRYSVAVTSAEGCTGFSDTVAVTVSPLPDVSIAGPATVCADGMGIYTVPEEPNRLYTWRLESANGAIVSGEGTPRVTVRWGAPEEAALYLTARDETSGCVDSAVYAVTVGSELRPVISGPAVICAGERVELDAGEGYASYEWSTGERTRTIEVSESMTVTVRVVDAGGCEGESEEFVVTKREALAVQLTPGGEVLLCEGGEQEIGASPGYASYVWSTGETGSSIRVTTAGEYWVEVTDADGCTGRSDTVRVVRSDAGVKLVPGGDLTLCEGDSLRIDAPGGYASYAWSTGETSASIVVRTSGAYWVVVEGSGGCTFDSDTARVAAVARPAPVVVRAGNVLTSSAATSYQWLRDGVEIAGATEREYVITGPGAYRVRVTNVEGCTAESEEVKDAVTRIVWLDTVEGNVGERLWLGLQVDPPLVASDKVTGYRAWLRVDPQALYPRSVTAGGVVHYDGYGGLVMEGSGPALSGSELFGVELQGLVTGSLENVVWLDSVELVGPGRAAVAGHGLVILHGCELGGSFVKGSRIVSIAPNPAAEEIEVLYYAPPGGEVRLRLLDILGRGLIELNPESGRGEEQVVRLRVADLPDGVYLIELQDGEGAGVAPLLIQR